MIRKGRQYQPSEILPLVEFASPVVEDGSFGDLKVLRKDLDGDLINFASGRLQCFSAKGIECVSCGLVGEFFVKEKHHPREPYFHLGFYTINKDGEEVLMTKDHIKSRKNGGKDHLSNYQTMCFPCNQRKGSDNDPEAGAAFVFPPLSFLRSFIKPVDPGFAWAC